MTRRRIVLAFLAVAALAACGKGGGSQPAKTYPDTAAGFDQFAHDLIQTVKDGKQSAFTAMAKNLKLPDAGGFFTKTFGPDVGPRLLVEYGEKPIGNFEGAWKDMRAMVVDEGRTTVNTTRHTDGSDELATGYQSIALKDMKQPVALYRLQLTRPDGSKSFTLWSFVHVDGAFRLAGQMKEVRPQDPTEDMHEELDLLGQLPMIEARKMMEDHR